MALPFPTMQIPTILLFLLSHPLSSLKLLGAYNRPLPSLPSSLEELHAGEAFNHPIPTLPDYLQSIYILNRSYDYSVNLPPHLLKSGVFRRIPVTPDKHRLLIGNLFILFLFFFIFNLLIIIQQVKEEYCSRDREIGSENDCTQQWRLCLPCWFSLLCFSSH